MTRASAAAATAVALLSSLTGGACLTDRIIVEDAHGKLVADPAQFARVEASTAEERRLPFVAAVPADVMTVAELRQWFDRYADVRKAELEKEDRFFHRTNILPPTVSTAEAYKGFLADFVGGVYDDGSKRMILVSDYAWWAKIQQDVVGYITGIDWAYEVFLAHELTHALQDQHFGLGEMLKGGVYEDNDDAAFVRKTLLETEANVVGMSHFLGMDLEQLATRKAFFLFMRYNNLLNGPLLMALSGRTPSYFAKQAFSQYELGLSFIEKKLDDGGMDELSRSYVRVPGEKGGVPESTEQLLWPRKMRSDSLDRPVPIEKLAAPPASLPGSKLVITNVFGALAFKHWLERLDGGLVGGAVADGWGGDRWDVVDDGGVSVLVWRTTWDSAGDAREFFDAYVAAVPARYGDRAQESAASEEGASHSDDDHATIRFAVPQKADEQTWVRTKRDEVVHIERRGRDVLIVEGVTPDRIDAVVAEMWTKLVRGAPPVVDTERLAEKAKLLEEHINDVEHPAAHGRVDLLGRLFLPARTMAIRLGTGLGVDERGLPAGALKLPLDDPRALDALFLVNDSEMRWGFRPHLELSMPLALAGEVRTPLGQTIGGVALRSLFPAPSVSLSASQALPIGDVIAVAVQGSLDDVGAAQTTRVAAGALLRPFAQLVVAPAVARVVDVDAAEGAPAQVILGSALRRGTVAQPLVELEIIEGLYVFENTALFFDQSDKGLRFTGHTHAAGLLLYF